jgi:4-alpha-glucanotransferase
VRCPEPELLAVLCDVGRRHGVLLIGEDLGTVPEGFSESMRGRGLLSSRVLLFERDADGFHPSDRWPAECLATVNTHDLPPLPGWLAGDDLALRRATGQIGDDATLERVRQERRDDRESLLHRLVQEGDLPARAAGDDDWLEATTRFLCRTPAVLVGLSLDDLAGEREPINLPGVSAPRHRSWVRRMRAPLDAVCTSPRARLALEAVPVTRKRLG